MPYVKTYVRVDWRSDVPGPDDRACVCCQDKRGYGHIFCHSIHGLDDKDVRYSDIVTEALEKAEVADGDEFEVIVRKTGRRPFGDSLMVHLYKNGRHSTPVLERVPGPKKEKP